jgi:hypothetical protein
MANGKWQMIPGNRQPATGNWQLFTAVSAAMGTIGIVQTGLGNQEVVEDFSSQDRPGDDPGHVLDGDPAIPDSLGIDHDGRAMLTLVEAARVIGAGQGAKSRLPQLNLESIFERLETRRVAAAPLVAGFTNVPADEDVVREGRHVSSHESGL